MRARAEHEPILRLGLGVPRDPALRVEELRVGVNLGVVQRRVARGHDHGALGYGVLGRDGEGFCGLVGDEDDGRAVAEELLDDSVGVGEGGVEHGEVEGAGLVTAASG